jgi:hypothetical protein
MAKNELLIRRTAFGTFTLAATDNTANHSSNVLTLKGGSGCYLPTGAIVTGIRTFTFPAVTNGANAKNATLNAYVGAVALGTNDVVASAIVVQTIVGSIAVAGSGTYVATGGPVLVVLASSDSARTGIALSVDVYVDYIICDDRDKS